MKSARRIAGEIVDEFASMDSTNRLSTMIEAALVHQASKSFVTGAKQERARMTAALKDAGVDLLPRFFEDLDESPEPAEIACPECGGRMEFGLHGPTGATTEARCLSGAYRPFDGAMLERCGGRLTLRRCEDGGIEVVGDE